MFYSSPAPSTAPRSQARAFGMPCYPRPLSWTIQIIPKS